MNIRTVLRRLVFLAAVLGTMTQHKMSHAEGDSWWAFVGTYTGGVSEGIYVFRFYDDGSVGEVKLATAAVDPSFLALHPNGRYLYAVNEVGDFGGESSGAVSAFKIDPRTGQLTLLNQQPSRGAAPCHLVVDQTGRHVLVANYTGGSVAVLPVGPDGQLAPASTFIQHEGSSVIPERQSGPHAHSINLDAHNRFAVAADLGLDRLLVYAFDPVGGTLKTSPGSVDVAPGAGPRHFAFHPNNRFAYVINEINLTVTAFAFDGDTGQLAEIQTESTVPEDVDRTGFSTAEILVHPSGKFLYGSNRGHNSIAIFAIDEVTGRVSPLGQSSTLGETPRNFVIDPTGHFLMAENQQSNTIAFFRIDQDRGTLAAEGGPIHVPSPVCIRFLSAPNP